MVGDEQVGTLGNCLGYLEHALQSGHAPPPSSTHSCPLLSKLTFQTSGFLQQWLSELGLLLTRHLWGPHSRIDRSLLKYSWLGLDQRCPWKLKISGSQGWAQSCPHHYQSRSPGHSTLPICCTQSFCQLPSWDPMSRVFPPTCWSSQPPQTLHLLRMFCVIIFTK